MAGLCLRDIMEGYLVLFSYPRFAFSIWVAVIVVIEVSRCFASCLDAALHLARSLVWSLFPRCDFGVLVDLG